MTEKKTAEDRPLKFSRRKVGQLTAAALKGDAGAARTLQDLGAYLEKQAAAPRAARKTRRAKQDVLGEVVRQIHKLFEITRKKPGHGDSKIYREIEALPDLSLGTAPRWAKLMAKFCRKNVFLRYPALNPAITEIGRTVMRVMTDPHPEAPSFIEGFLRSVFSGEKVGQKPGGLIYDEIAGVAMRNRKGKSVRAFQKRYRLPSGTRLRPRAFLELTRAKKLEVLERTRANKLGVEVHRSAQCW